MYDIIGDIHGYADELETLLDKLGYAQTGGVHQHPERTVIFLGDFIDRGPHQRRTLNIVRGMIDAGAALAVMGNHEYNAIAWFTPSDDGGHLRGRNHKNKKQHAAFLKEYEGDPAAWADAIAWFRTLPLWLDLDGIRVVHACWDKALIDRLSARYGASPRLDDDLLDTSADPYDWQFHAIRTLLKGKKIKLPSGHSITDKEGHVRHEIRVRWWDNAATYRDAYMGPEHALIHIPDEPIDGDHVIDYSHTEPPVFLGHYWFEGTPAPLAPNIACVDYSVAREGGKLTAYRWDGETTLEAAKFVSVPRQS